MPTNHPITVAQRIYGNSVAWVDLAHTLANCSNGRPVSKIVEQHYLAYRHLMNDGGGRGEYLNEQW